MTFSAQELKKIEQADALIFDMDGTLIDSMPLHYQAWSEVAKTYQLPFSKERFYQLGGVPTYETLEILSREANVLIDIAQAKKLKESLYRSQLDKVVAIPQTLEVVHRFYGHKPMAIATGSSKTGAERVLGHLGLLDLFAAVLTADDVENHKPAPDVFLKAASALGIAPAQCVAFEDTDIGLQAIELAGMIAIDVRLIVT